MKSFSAWQTARLVGLVLLAWQMSMIAVAGDEAVAGETQIEMTLGDLLGKEQSTRYEDIIDADELISWRVYVPKNDSNELPGVLVYVSPTRSGKIHPQWREVMDAQNLIYISADHSGNYKPTIRRMVLALMSPGAIVTSKRERTKRTKSITSSESRQPESIKSVCASSPSKAAGPACK